MSEKKAPLTPEQALAAIRAAAESGNIEEGETSELEFYSDEATKICDALESTLGIRIGFLSDMSSLSDFAPRGEYPPTDAYFERLSLAIGVVIERGDSVDLRVRPGAHYFLELLLFLLDRPPRAVSDTQSTRGCCPAETRPLSVTTLFTARISSTLPRLGSDRGVMCAWSGFYAHQNQEKPRPPS